MKEKFDVLIKNGKVIDGTGNPWFCVDIGINGGKIAKIRSNLDSSASKIIDATNLIVSPGFIDMHSHDGWAILQKISLESMVRQGITTAVIGNCGFSIAPLTLQKKERIIKQLAAEYPELLEIDIPWLSFKEYLKFLENSFIPINFIPLTGYHLIRANVLDFEDKTPSADELKQMKLLMEEGVL